jgi:hypothetical protein
MTKPTRATRRASRRGELSVTTTLTGAAAKDGRRSHKPAERAQADHSWSHEADRLIAENAALFAAISSARKARRSRQRAAS